MEPRKKKILIRRICVGVGVLLLAWIFWPKDYSIYDQETAKLTKELKGVLNDVYNLPVDQEEERADVYDSSSLLKNLLDYGEQTASIDTQLKELYDELAGSSGQEVSEQESRAWQDRLKEATNASKKLAQIKKETQGIYDSQLLDWEKVASEYAMQANSQESSSQQLEERLQALSKKAQTLWKKSQEVSYEIAIRRCNQVLKRAKKASKFLEQSKNSDSKKALKEAKQRLLKEDNTINHETDTMREIDEALKKIVDQESNPYDWNGLVAPRIKPTPPPPSFKPDVNIATTGDLSEALLEPVVIQWLSASGAKPAKGRVWSWNTGESLNERELEADVPPALQGDEPSKLRIRITTVNDQEIFNGLMPGNGVDLVLTDRKIAPDKERAWLNGKTLEQLDPKERGRAYRSRLCSDALLFFQGKDLKLPSVDADVLMKTPKVFCSDEMGRKSAASLFNLYASDLYTEQNFNDEDISSITDQNPNALVVGVWHRDNKASHRALSVANSPLSYRPSLRNGPESVRSESVTIVPSENSINAGRYAYAYNVSFYRPTQVTVGSEQAAKLMKYACNVQNKEMATTIRRQGFVPIRLDVETKHGVLTESDLPIKSLLKQLPADFGYEADVQTWVYGTRISIPLYYEVGSATVGDIVMDPDSQYYSAEQGIFHIRELTKDKKAALVVVGHTDPQWNKKLNGDRKFWEESRRGNQKLSEQRATGAYETLFKASCQDLVPVSFGCSFNRPECDISLNKSVEEQASELERCRRVEVFVVFPLMEE